LTTTPVKDQPATDFVKSVLRLRPSVAVFDCDGTLWSGDSGQDFFYWEINRGLVPKDVADAMLRRYDEYLAGRVAEEPMCGEMVTMHAGLPEDEIKAAAREFFSSVIAPRIFPEMQELAVELAQQDCEVWAVSSTNEWVVKEGARRFGIAPDHVLAACVASENGRATNRLLDVPTDAGKATSIRKYIKKTVDAVFGNTMHDAAMLELARHAFAINPTAELRTLAEQRGWMIYESSSK
jgi:phosphoserine phosphatase